WPHAADTRVASCAFDICFWRPNIEADLARNPALNWPAAFPDLEALISTRTSKWIFVNGVHLRKGGADRFLYGHLRTGDVVTVFGPDELVPPAQQQKQQQQQKGGKKKVTTEWLEFEVDIKIGRGKEVRGKNDEEKFVVEERSRAAGGGRGSSIAPSGSEKGDEPAGAGAKDPAKSFPPPPAKPKPAASSTHVNKSMRAPGKGK
ncbi:MAG: hypothetical protein Q9207_008590, partial [Kuettlingeria erythrocarpa]